MSWRYCFHPATYNSVIKQNGFFMTDGVMKIHTLMVNTLQSTPEINHKSGSNLWKKAAALLLALTLSGQPAESKTFGKQEFTTEMVANNPWEYSPMTENVEQSTVPNYINQAQVGVKKYYPQYEKYFEPIFITIKDIGNYNIKIINTKIMENLEIFSDEIRSEKDKITTTLIVLEKITGANSFYKSNDVEIIDPKEWYDIREGVATEIIWDVNLSLVQELKNIKTQIKAAERLNNQLKSIWGKSNWEKEKILTEIEDFFKSVNEKRIKESKSMQEFIETYININKKIGREPNNVWKKIIEEYKNIKNCR